MNVPSRRVAIDCAIAAMLLIGSAVWATRFWNAWTASGGQALFYQNYFEPAVMVACGKGFVVAEPPRPAALVDFLNQRRDQMTCADLPADLKVGKNGLFQGAWIYLEMTVGLAWRVLGISWSRMGPLFGLLFGAVVALVYAICRLGMGRAAAIVCALGIATSGTHLANLPHLRDYAKAPFTLALVLILGLVVLRPVRRAVLVWLALAYGLVLGIGYGFRTDFLIDVPVFPIVVFAFLDGGVRANLASKAIASAVCLATFALVSWPIVTAVSEQGGCQWHVALLGLQSTFDDSLGVAPAPYEFGYAYSDEYVITNVQGFAQRTQPGAPVATYCTHDYDVQSGRYLRAIASSFPADLITRAYGSVLQIAELPFRSTLSTLQGWKPGLYELRRSLMQPEIGWGVWIVAAAMIAVASVSLRLGTFLLFFVAYFGGYPAVQFQERHHFHLEFITWWAAGFLVHQAVTASATWRRAASEWSVLARGAGRSVVFAAAAAVLIVGVLTAARWYQRREAAAILASYETVAKTPLDSTDGALPATATAAWPQFLEIDFDRTKCGPTPSVTFRHAPVPILGDLSHTIRMGPRPESPGLTRVFQPVFASYQRFEVTDDGPGCVAGASRVADLQALPLLLGATMAPGWRSESLHQRVARWERDPWPLTYHTLPRASWTTTTGAHRALNRFGALHLIGNRSAGDYQLTSPPVTVRPGAHVRLHMSVTAWHGRICVGALDATGAKWLAPPIVTRQDLRFAADAAGGFMAAVVNCNASPTRFPSVFSVSAAAYAIE